MKHEIDWDELRKMHRFSIITGYAIAIVLGFAIKAGLQHDWVLMASCITGATLNVWNYIKNRRLIRLALFMEGINNEACDADDSGDDHSSNRD